MTSQRRDAHASVSAPEITQACLQHAPTLKSMMTPALLHVYRLQGDTPVDVSVCRPTTENIIILPSHCLLGFQFSDFHVSKVGLYSTQSLLYIVSNTPRTYPFLNSCLSFFNQCPPTVIHKNTTVNVITRDVLRSVNREGSYHYHRGETQKCIAKLVCCTTSQILVHYLGHNPLLKIRDRFPLLGKRKLEKKMKKKEA